MATEWLSKVLTLTKILNMQGLSAYKAPDHSALGRYTCHTISHIFILATLQYVLYFFSETYS